MMVYFHVLKVVHVPLWRRYGRSPDSHFVMLRMRPVVDNSATRRFEVDCVDEPLHQWPPTHEPHRTHVRVVCISDTHERHAALEVPPGDILVHAGDILLQNRGVSPKALQQLDDFNRFLGSLPHRHKVVVAGNHDQVLMDLGAERVRAVLSHAVYLENEYAVLPVDDEHEVHVFGSPFSRRGNSDNRAFQHRRGQELHAQWEPLTKHAKETARRVDLLVTHDTPDGHAANDIYGQCVHTRNFAETVQPVLHVCGHVHSYAGTSQWSDDTHSCLVVNATSVTRSYLPYNPPIVVDIPVSLLLRHRKDRMTSAEPAAR